MLFYLVKFDNNLNLYQKWFVKGWDSFVHLFTLSLIVDRKNLKNVKYSMSYKENKYSWNLRKLVA